MGKQFFYRGYLTSCNYSCGYCPFSKRKMTETQEKKDREALAQFVCQMEQETEEHALQIVPYGEALIHEYYWEALARLSRIKTEVYTGCQTNLSFPVEKMLSIYETCKGQRRKLRLWCTFHPSMTSIDDFAAQCRLLDQAKITYCAGTVGDPGNLSQIRKLREQLPDNVYVWVNKMDGRKKGYTMEEINSFREIDPFFHLELKHWRSDHSRCRQSVFQEADGSRYFCNLHAAQAKGGDAAVCKRRECSCYLAYCNRTDIQELRFFEPYPAFRIPAYPKGIFLDIDGTLIEEGARTLSDAMAQKIRWLSQKSRLYLATALPYPEAMAKCQKIAGCLLGGVFADGGHILLWENSAEKKKRIKWEEVIPVYPEGFAAFDIRSLAANACCRSYQIRGVMYKQTLFAKGKRGWQPKEAQMLAKELRASLADVANIRIYKENRHISILGAEASKKTGVAKICAREHITWEEGMAVGNEEADIPMLSLFPRSILAKQGLFPEK